MGGSLENLAVHSIDWSSEMVFVTYVFGNLSEIRDRNHSGDALPIATS